jgi:hypothetical protein
VRKKRWEAYTREPSKQIQKKRTTNEYERKRANAAVTLHNPSSTRIIPPFTSVLHANLRRTIRNTHKANAKLNPLSHDLNTREYEHTIDSKMEFQVLGELFLPTENDVQREANTNGISNYRQAWDIREETPANHERTPTLSTSFRIVHASSTFLAKEYYHLSACHFPSTAAHSRGSCRRPTCTTGSR